MISIYRYSAVLYPGNDHPVTTGEASQGVQYVFVCRVVLGCTVRVRTKDERSWSLEMFATSYSRPDTNESSARSPVPRQACRTTPCWQSSGLQAAGPRAGSLLASVRSSCSMARVCTRSTWWRTAGTAEPPGVSESTSSSAGVL